SSTGEAAVKENVRHDQCHRQKRSFRHCWEICSSSLPIYMNAARERWPCQHALRSTREAIRPTASSTSARLPCWIISTTCGTKLAIWSRSSSSNTTKPDCQALFNQLEPSPL